MFFLSSKELSQKWGISQRRVILLAREGRITGAKLCGKSWIFPENSQKPANARAQAVQGKPLLGNEGFRYPIFEYREPLSYNPPLDQEELCMKAVVEAFHGCRFQEAERLLGDLPETALNRYHRISLQYIGCMVDIVLCNTKRFMARYGRLTLEIQENFPYKTEMSEYLHQIDATIGFDSYYQSQFRIDAKYPYHVSYLPRLCNICALRFLVTDNIILPEQLQAHEINCLWLENQGYWSDLQSLHLSLGIAYNLMGKAEERNIHLKKVLELAQKYEMYYQFLDSFYYMRRIFTPALNGFPVNFAKKLKKLSDDYHKRYIRFMDEMAINSIYKLLNKEDYILLLYALQGLTNKDVAEKLKISIGTVGKQYSELYAALKVKSKRELVKFYRDYDMNLPSL